MKKVIKLIDPSSGLMECKVCGATHFASLQPDKKRYYRGSWQCQNKCKIDETEAVIKSAERMIKRIDKAQEEYKQYMKEGGVKIPFMESN